MFEDKFTKVPQPKTQRSHEEIQSLQDQVYLDFFNDLLKRNRLENISKPLNLKLYGRKREEEKMDGHEFYIKTFNACNGWKYIFYNYEKHMKGLS